LPPKKKGGRFREDEEGKKRKNQKLVKKPDESRLLAGEFRTRGKKKPEEKKAHVHCTTKGKKARKWKAMVVLKKREEEREGRGTRSSGQLNRMKSETYELSDWEKKEGEGKARSQRSVLRLREKERRKGKRPGTPLRW